MLSFQFGLDHNKKSHHRSPTSGSFSVTKKSNAIMTYDLVSNSKLGCDEFEGKSSSKNNTLSDESWQGFTDTCFFISQMSRKCSGFLRVCGRRQTDHLPNFRKSATFHPNLTLHPN